MFTQEANTFPIFFYDTIETVILKKIGKKSQQGVIGVASFRELRLSHQ
jgi:hypothetical protein